MCVGMIAKQMPAYRNFLHQIRTFANKFSYQKKCRVYRTAIEEFEKTGSDGRIGAIVKCESNFLRGICMPHSGAIHLRRRSNSSPRGAACYGRCTGDDGPWIQFDSNRSDSRTAASPFSIFVVGRSRSIIIIFTADSTLLKAEVTGKRRSASKIRLLDLI